MSHSRNQRRKALRRAAGKGRTTGYWELVSMTYRTIRGIPRTGYRVRRFTI